MSQGLAYQQLDSWLLGLDGCLLTLTAMDGFRSRSMAGS